MLQPLKAFVKDEEGQGLVEYALLLALVVIVSVVALKELGTAVRNTFQRSSDSL